MKEKQSLTLKQKILVAIVFLVSALATSEMAHLYIEKNGEYEYSIFRWIIVHQWSIVPAVGSVWLLNWKKIELIKQIFYKSLTELGSYTSHDLYFRNSGTSFSINICSLNLRRYSLFFLLSILVVGIG